MTSLSRQQENVRAVIRRYMTRPNHPEGPVTLSITDLAERFNQPVAVVRAALISLESERGRGVHQISGSVYEYRPVERSRKKTDTQVRVKVARYMQGTKPGSLHMVKDIAEACDTLPASTSGALKELVKDPYLYIKKVSHGTFSYRPPGTPNSAEPAPTPAVMPPRRTDPVIPSGTVPADEETEITRTFAVVDEDEDEDEPERPTPRLDATLAATPPWDENEIPEGWLKVIHTTPKGTRLAEDHTGNVFKVTPIEEQ